MMALSSEFEQMRVREDELPELERLAQNCPYELRGGPESTNGKVNIMLQVSVSKVASSERTSPFCCQIPNWQS